jgi:hypothetical protein
LVYRGGAPSYTTQTTPISIAFCAMMNIMDHDNDDFGGENEDDDVSLEDDENKNEERNYDVICSLVDNDPTLTH